MRHRISVATLYNSDDQRLTDETQMEQLEQPFRQLVPPDLPSVILVEARDENGLLLVVSH